MFASSSYELRQTPLFLVILGLVIRIHNIYQARFYYENLSFDGIEDCRCRSNLLKVLWLT